MSEYKYLVKRAFKSYGEVFVPGTKLTGEEHIKLFNSKLCDNKIIRIPDESDHETRESLEYYYKEKLGIEINLTDTEKAGKGKKLGNSETPKADEAKPNTTPPPGTQKEKTAAELLKELKNK